MNSSQENCPVHAVLSFLSFFLSFFVWGLFCLAKPWRKHPELAEPGLTTCHSCHIWRQRSGAEAGEKEHKLQDGRLVIRTYEARKVETCFAKIFINAGIVRMLVLSYFVLFFLKVAGNTMTVGKESVANPVYCHSNLIHTNVACAKDNLCQPCL